MKNIKIGSYAEIETFGARAAHYARCKIVSADSSQICISYPRVTEKNGHITVDSQADLIRESAISRLRYYHN